MGRSAVDAAPPTQADFAAAAFDRAARTASPAPAGIPDLAVSTSAAATAGRCAEKIPNSDHHRGGHRCGRGATCDQLVGVALFFLAPQHWPPRFFQRGPPGFPNGQDPTAGHTESYKAGYWWAYQNSERMQSGVMINSAQTVCANTASSEAPVQGLNTQEWTQGCVDSWNKMGYGKSGPSSPGSIDCSKPGDGNDNGFHDINCPP